MGRTLGWLFLGGALIGAAAVWLLPLPASTDETGTLAVMGVSAVLGAFLRHYADRLPPMAIQGFLALGTLAISADIALAGGHTVGDQIFYLWTALCAFYYATRRAAAVQLALIAAGYGAALLVSHTHQAETKWVIVLGSLAGMWFVIDRLVSGLESAGEEVLDRSRELVGAEQRFRSAFEDAATGMTLADFDGTWIRVNRAFADFLGTTVEDLAGRSFRDFCHPDDVDLTEEKLDTGREDGLWAIDRRYVRADGRVAWGHVSVSLVRDAAGEPVNLISQIQDITERRRAEVSLAHQAVHDPLTGLPNRLLFLDRLTLGIARLARNRGVLAVLFLDLDRFKLVNDSFGHNSGDEVIAEVARRLRELLRPEDTLARFGGDEFTILCESEDPRAAEGVAGRVGEALAEPIQVGGRSIFLSASIGISRTESARADAERLLAEADAAMYRAKEGGRSRFAVFDPAMRLRGAERLEIESGLRRALEHDELRLHFQPQIDLAGGRIVAVEALVRWQHPERGLLAPGEFIGVAEDSRLILPLGEQVLEKACAQAVAWRAEGLALRMSVNLSPRQLADPDIVGTVSRALARTGLEPAALCLEITENAVIDDLASGIAALEALKDLGVSLAIDDFGVGFSSLNQVRRLSPVDVLKIDRSFIAGLEGDAQEGALVSAVIGIARALELHTVAEGIETPGQAAVLRRLGCETGQGFLFARPVPAEQIAPLVRRGALGELVA